MHMLSVLSAISARPRQSWLVPLCALATPLLGLSEPALAQCAGPASNTICAPGVNPPAEYTSGISVGTNQTPIEVTLQSGVVVNIPAGSGVAHAVALDNTSGGPGTGVPATLFANNAAVSIDTTSLNPPDTSALFVHAAGDATITASGVIDVTGTTSTNALWATVFTTADVPKAVASVTYDGPATGPGITETGGANSTLIQACANDDCGFGNVVAGDAKIDAAGNLTGFGGSAPSTTGMNGLFAAAGATGAMRP